MSNEMFDDYTKASFPLTVPFREIGFVRLYAAAGGKVLGVTFFDADKNGEPVEFCQALVWDGQGLFSYGEHPAMNLPPPPAAVANRLAAINEELAACHDRLDRMPDAPAEWRDIDLKRITALLKEKERLGGSAAA